MKRNLSLKMTGSNNHMFGKKLTEKHKKKLSTAKKGSKHPNWKGGITSLNHQIRICFKMRQWSSDIFTRDNFTCQNCFKKGCYLHAHHVKPFALILRENNIKNLEEALNCVELWNINNGQTLCEICHKKTDSYKNRFI